MIVYTYSKQIVLDFLLLKKFLSLKTPIHLVVG